MHTKGLYRYLGSWLAWISFHQVVLVEQLATTSAVRWLPMTELLRGAPLPPFPWTCWAVAKAYGA